MSTRLVIIGGSDAGISAGLRAKDVPEKEKRAGAQAPTPDKFTGCSLTVFVTQQHAVSGGSPSALLLRPLERYFARTLLLASLPMGQHLTSPDRRKMGPSVRLRTR